MTVAIDWGSTSFRAFHFDDDGNLLNKYQGEHGIKKAQGLTDHERNAWFEKTLVEACGGWIAIDRKAPSVNKKGFANAWITGGSDDAVDVVLSGMVTSRNGWIETPYIECPVQLSDLRKHSVRRTFAGARLAFLPGVSVGGNHPDVMRGEELQLIGVELRSVNGVRDAAGIERDQTIFVLPGTHSKWASCHSLLIDGVSDDVYADDVYANNEAANGARLTIESFHTCPSGELYDSLLNHTLIGGLAVQGEWSETTFLAAVKSGFSSQRLLSSLFAARSGVLLESLEATAAPAYLSGLLIGREIREGIDELAARQEDGQSSSTAVAATASGQGLDIVLIGEPKLCGLYLQALQALNLPARAAGADMSEAGFRKLIGY